MTTLWEESNVKINHPGQQELKQGDMEERTENILYPTNDGAYVNAVRRYYEKIVGVPPERNETIDNMLKYMYSLKSESEVRKEINNILRTGGGGIPKHDHLRQVDGAAEVYSLIGGEVDKRSVTYEKIREQSVETMRENPTYQFCMLLAGFNNDKMDKYWITPSEIMLKKNRKRKIDPILDRTSEGDKLSKEIISLETQLRNITYYIESVKDDIDPEIPLTDEQWKRDALEFIVASMKRYFGTIEETDNNGVKINKMLQILMEYVVTYLNADTWFNVLSTTIVKRIEEAVEEEKTFTYDSSKNVINLSKLNTSYKQIEKITEQIKNKKKARQSYSHLSNPQGFHNWYTTTAWADGRLHLSPLVYAHIEEAYNVVRRKWGHLKGVPLNLFIESPDVRSYFARLVAWCMRTSDCLSGKRFHLQSTYARVNHEKHKLLNIFRHVTVGKRELLYNRNPEPYPYISGTQTNINNYLDDKQLISLKNPPRRLEDDIVRNMMSVNRAMQMSKAYNNI